MADYGGRCPYCLRNHSGECMSRRPEMDPDTELSYNRRPASPGDLVEISEQRPNELVVRRALDTDNYDHTRDTEKRLEEIEERMLVLEDRRRAIDAELRELSLEARELKLDHRERRYRRDRDDEDEIRASRPEVVILPPRREAELRAARDGRAAKRQSRDSRSRSDARERESRLYEPVNEWRSVKAADAPRGDIERPQRPYR